MNIDRQPGSLSDPDAPRWTDHDLAVLIELAHSTGYHRRRLGLPETDDGLTFRQRCRRRLAWLCTPPGGGHLWVGIDEEPVNLDGYRGLPAELRYLRRQGGAA